MLLPAVLWLDPVRFNFYYGELAIFAVAFVATDLWWTRPGRWQRWVPQGLLTGIAAVFTLRPVVFALFGAAQRFTGANGASALWVLAVLVIGGALIYAARVFIQRGEAPMAAVSLALAALTRRPGRRRTRGRGCCRACSSSASSRGAAAASSHC